jgi:hypothetical protein
MWAKIRDRVSVTIMLSLLGAIIGGIVGAIKGDGAPQALEGAIIGAVLSLIDILYLSFLLLVMGGGVLLVLGVGIYQAFNNTQTWLRIFYVVGAIALVLGIIIGASDGRGTEGAFRGILIAVLIAGGVTTVLCGVGFLAGGSDTHASPSGPSPPDGPLVFPAPPP